MKANYFVSIVLLVSLVLGCGLAGDAIAQKKTRTRLKVYYEKLSNNDKKISMELIQGSGKKMAGVQNAEIFLTTYKEALEIDLASIFTDADGKALLLIEEGYKFPLNAEGYAIINASYKGNDSLRAASKEIEFLDLNVDISFKVIDSVNHIVVAGYELDSLGEKIPIEGIDLNIGVERLYSILYLEKIETEEDGMGTMEFPNDIPGDSVGNLNVIVKINDHDDYGSITKSANVNWGSFVDYKDTEFGRSLFGEEAPMWMIIAVFIILAGAWFHFILAITKVLKMSRLEEDPTELPQEDPIEQPESELSPETVYIKK